MSKYEARYNETELGVYTMMVRIEKDGFEQVARDFKGRYFKTMATAQKATAKYLEKKQ